MYKYLYVKFTFILICIYFIKKFTTLYKFIIRYYLFFSKILEEGNKKSKKAYDISNNFSFIFI